MISIVFNGRIKNKKAVIEFMDRVAVELNIHRLRTKSIEVTMKTRIAKGKHYGDCWGDTTEVEIDIARHMDDGPVAYTDILKTIAHEMVHGKQYLRGELNGWHDKWQGKSTKKYDNTPYKDLPWEIEALALEEVLYKKCWEDFNPK